MLDHSPPGKTDTDGETQTLPEHHNQHTTGPNDEHHFSQPAQGKAYLAKSWMSAPTLICPPTYPPSLFLPPSLLKSPEADSETCIRMQVVGGDPWTYEVG